MRACWVGIALCLLSTSCDSTSGDDAGVTVDAPAVVDAGIPEPAPPADPAPVEWTCPDGWSEVAVGSVTACEPWPSDWSGCPAGERRFVGDAACAPWGTDCPSGDEWASGLPATGVVYVLAGAAAGGDGTRATPFATITEGVAAAVDGDVIAIGRGSYDEAVTIDKAVTLRGACVAETDVRTTIDSTATGVLVATVDGVTIEDLSVGGNRTAIRVDGGTTHVRGVLVSEAEFLGLLAFGGTLDVTDSVVSRQRVPGDSGASALAGGGSTLRLTRTIVEDSESGGLLVFQTDSRLELTDVVVRRTVEAPVDDFGGIGLAIGEGGTATLSRVAFEQNTVAHVFVQFGGRFEGSDIVMRGLLAAELMDTAAAAISVTEGATATLDRALIANNRSAGVVVVDEESVATLRDVVLTGMYGSEMVPDAAGLFCARFGLIDGERIHVADQERVAIVADDYGSVALRDVDVDGVESSLSDGLGGRCLAITTGAAAEVDRLRCRNTRETALFVAMPESVLNARDVRVEDVRSQLESDSGGRAITVRGGAQASFERVVLTRAREAGVLAYGIGTGLVMRDARVEETLLRACDPGACSGAGGGTAVAATDGASLTLERFALVGNLLAGLQLARGVTVDVRDGLVAQNAIGVNIQDVDIDLDALREGVVYRDNGVNLDSSELFIPDPDS